MKFSETLKHTGPDLVVSQRHDAWLLANDHPVYSEEAISFATAMLTSVDRNRVGTLSASSLGECARYQQFVYLGMPKIPPDQKGAMKMANGAFMHLRWQMAGLTEGWLPQAEVWVSSAEHQLVGTMDGICYDDSILELKSINMNGFSRVQTFGPLIPHLFQMATYMLCTGREQGRFVYECKDNQEYLEVPITADQLPMSEAEDKAEALVAANADHRLFEPLGKCIDRTGWVYTSCPFRDRCLHIQTWEEAAA
jgi:hypothetical protein